jgi:hypothetical protein
MVSTAPVTWPDVGDGRGLEFQALPQKISCSFPISITAPPLSSNFAALEPRAKVAEPHCFQKRFS